MRIELYVACCRVYQYTDKRYECLTLRHATNILILFKCHIG